MYEKEKIKAEELCADKLGYMDGTKKGESLLHIEAFEYYYSLGNARDIDKVAKAFNKSPRTIASWRAKFGWVERIKMRDIEVSKKLVQQTTAQAIDEKVRYRKIIKLAMAKMIQEIQSEDFKTKGIQDLERLIKLDMLLLGENTEKVEVTNNVVTEDDRKALNDLSKNISSLVDL